MNEKIGIDPKYIGDDKNNIQNTMMSHSFLYYNPETKKQEDVPLIRARWGLLDVMYSLYIQSSIVRLYEQTSADRKGITLSELDDLSIKCMRILHSSNSVTILNSSSRMELVDILQEMTAYVSPMVVGNESAIGQMKQILGDKVEQIEVIPHMQFIHDIVNRIPQSTVIRHAKAPAVLIKDVPDVPHIGSSKILLANTVNRIRRVGVAVNRPVTPTPAVIPKKEPPRGNVFDRLLGKLSGLFMDQTNGFDYMWIIQTINVSIVDLILSLENGVLFENMKEAAMIEKNKSMSIPLIISRDAYAFKRTTLVEHLKKDNDILNIYIANGFISSSDMIKLLDSLRSRYIDIYDTLFFFENNDEGQDATNAKLKFRSGLREGLSELIEYDNNREDRYKDAGYESKLEIKLPMICDNMRIIYERLADYTNSFYTLRAHYTHIGATADIHKFIKTGKKSLIALNLAIFAGSLTINAINMLSTLHPVLSIGGVAIGIYGTSHLFARSGAYSAIRSVWGALETYIFPYLSAAHFTTNMLILGSLTFAAVVGIQDVYGNAYDAGIFVWSMTYNMITGVLMFLPMMGIQRFMRDADPYLPIHLLRPIKGAMRALFRLDASNRGVIFNTKYYVGLKIMSSWSYKGLSTVFSNFIFSYMQATISNRDPKMWVDNMKKRFLPLNRVVGNYLSGEHLSKMSAITRSKPDYDFVSALIAWQNPFFTYSSMGINKMYNTAAAFVTFSGMNHFLMIAIQGMDYILTFCGVGVDLMKIIEVPMRVINATGINYRELMNAELNAIASKINISNFNKTLFAEHVTEVINGMERSELAIAYSDNAEKRRYLLQSIFLSASDRLLNIITSVNEGKTSEFDEMHNFIKEEDVLRIAADVNDLTLDEIASKIQMQIQKTIETIGSIEWRAINTRYANVKNLNINEVEKAGKTLIASAPYAIMFPLSGYYFSQDKTTTEILSQIDLHVPEPIKTIEVEQSFVDTVTDAFVSIRKTLENSTSTIVAVIGPTVVTLAYNALFNKRPSAPMRAQIDTGDEPMHPDFMVVFFYSDRMEIFNRTLLMNEVGDLFLSQLLRTFFDIADHIKITAERFFEYAIKYVRGNRGKKHSISVMIERIIEGMLIKQLVLNEVHNMGDAMDIVDVTRELENLTINTHSRIMFEDIVLFENRHIVVTKQSIFDNDVLSSVPSDIASRITPSTIHLWFFFLYMMHHLITGKIL